MMAVEQQKQDGAVEKTSDVKPITSSKTVKPETFSDLLKQVMKAIVKRKKKKATGRTLSKGDVLKRYYGARNRHWLYGAVSFVMTAMFYMAFTSPDFVIQIADGLLQSKEATKAGVQVAGVSSAISAGIWAGVGLLFSVTITLLIMHSHTTEKSGLKVVGYAFIILLGVTFNVFTETASTMDRVDERVVVKSENSALSKALIGSIKSASGQGSKAYTKAMNDYADALSTKKIYCKRDKNHSKKLCKKWTMRTDEYQIAMALHAKNARSEKAETVELAKQASHNEEYAQMVIKVMMKQLDFSFLEATAIISLFIIGTFEILGIMIGGEYMRYRDLLPEYGIDLHKNKAVKYLKKDIKRKKKESKERGDYAIYQAEQRLKEMQSNKVIRSKLQRINDDIRKMAGGQQPAGAYGHSPISGSSSTVEPVASSAFKMGFVDTDGQGDAVQPMPLIEPVHNENIEMGLVLEGYSLAQLQARRADYKRAGGDMPTCPACNLPFPRQTWQDVFCLPEHRMAFNNQIRRLRRATKEI